MTLSDVGVERREEQTEIAQASKLLERPTPRREKVILGGLMALAAAIWSRGIGGESYWDDEAFSWTAAHLSWGQLFDLTVHDDAHTSMWHVVMKIWFSIYDGGEAWGRGLAMLAAVLTIPILWSIARRLFGVQVAMLACTFFVLHGSVVRYAQEGRSYALSMFAVAGVILLGLRAMESARRSDWIAAGLVGGLVPYVHPFSVIPVAAFGLLLVAYKRVSPRNQIAATVAFGAAIVPWLCLMLSQNPTSDKLDNIDPLSVELLKNVVGFIGAKAPLAIVITAAFAWMAVRVIRTRGSAEAFPYAMVGVWLLVMPAVLTVIALGKDLLVPRYLLPVVPAFALAAAVVVVGVWNYAKVPKVISGGLALSVAGVLALTSASQLDEPKGNWRDAIDLVATRSEPNSVIMARWHRPVVEYYMARQSESVRSNVRPADPIRAWGEPMTHTDPPLDLKSAASVNSAIGDAQSVWIVNRQGHIKTRVVETRSVLASKGYQMTFTRSFDRDVFVELWKK